MAYKEDLDIGKITLISLVSVLLTVALVVFLQVLFYGYKQRQLDSPRYSQVPADMTKYVADQQGKLVSYEVVDRERKVVTVPIELAMQRVVKELAADPRAQVTGVLDPKDVVESTPEQPPAEGAEGQGQPDGSAKVAPDPAKESAPAPPAEGKDGSSEQAVPDEDSGGADGEPAASAGENSAETSDDAPVPAADSPPADASGEQADQRAEDTSDADS